MAVTGTTHGTKVITGWNDRLDGGDERMERPIGRQSWQDEMSREKAVIKKSIFLRADTLGENVRPNVSRGTVSSFVKVSVFYVDRLTKE